MAYTKSPYTQTYDTQRLDFVNSPQNRDGSGTTDAKLLNMMVEVIDSPQPKNRQMWVRSRPGLVQAVSVSVAGGGTQGVGRGLIKWTYSGVDYCIFVIHNRVYYYNPNTITSGLLTTITTTTGVVGFTFHLSSAGVTKLFMCDGTKGYYFTAPTAAPTAVTDVNFPTPHIPQPVFLDGYIFVAKAGSQDIYNCQLDDVTNWTQTGSGSPGTPMFISCEMYEDKVVGLARNNYFIYGIGSASVQYFYDAGATPDSPLNAQPSAIQQFGCCASNTIVQTEKQVIFLGTTGNGGFTVWSIDGFKEKEISTPAVQTTLNAEGNNIANATAYCVRVKGQKLYIVNLTSRTLIYSFDTEMWTEWSSSNDQSATTVGTQTTFIGTYGTDGPDGLPWVQVSTLPVVAGTGHGANGTVYQVDPNNYDDDGTPFLCEIVTPKIDFGTFNRKFCNRLSLIGDIPDTSAVHNTVNVSWSDNDYETWSATRSLSFNNDFPSIAQLGSFRRRAFKFDYGFANPLRFEGVEFDINKGNQ